MELPNEDFRIKIALDTQILVYLVDNTYPNLNSFFKLLSENPFVDLVCSRFAIYEFIGIRKLENYLRCLVNESQSNGGIVNFSSAIKYKSDFDSPELKYSDAYQTVKNEVEKELTKIYDDFGIEYENFDIHNNIWKPHKELVLSTKISKEDSLLLISSVYPDIVKKENYLLFLTNDAQFYNSLCGEHSSDSDKIFSDNDIVKPYVYNMRNISIDCGTFFNLTDSSKIPDDSLNNFINTFILEHIKKKNSDKFIGKVTSCSANWLGKLLCFEMAGIDLQEEFYVTSISKDLKYSYNYRIKLSDFHNINLGKIEQFPYTPDLGLENSKVISVKVYSDKSKENLLEQNDYNKLATPGNYLFINPDN